MNERWLVVLSFCILTFYVSCSKEDSPAVIEPLACESVQFEDQFLKESFDIFKIYENVKGVVFVDEDNVEYYFRVEGIQDTMIYVENGTFCLSNRNIPIRKSFYGQRKRVKLNNHDTIIVYLNHQVDYVLGKENDYDENKLVDKLDVTAFKRISTSINTISWLDLLTSDRGGVMNIDEVNAAFSGMEYLEDFTFLGKNFKEVYGSDFYDLYFSQEFGVVSFKFYPPFGRLVFDRFEY